MRSFPPRALFDGLRLDALAVLASAVETDVRTSDGSEWRGGSPARRFLSAAGGEPLGHWFRSAALRMLLEKEAGCAAGPSGENGTYSYYVRPGDFIGIHRDIDVCDLAVITLLLDSSQGAAGKSVLWPSRREEPLSAVRSNPAHGALGLRMEEGDTLLLLGGQVPHAVLPVEPGQRRIVSLLCFQLAGEVATT